MSREQLVGLGFNRGAIAHRLRTQRLALVHPGVYTGPSQRLAQRGRQRAALLACSRLAVLSHLSAAAHLSLAQEGRAIHVSDPGASARRLQGVIVHRPRILHPDECTHRNGFPLTSVSLTLLDLAETIAFGHFLRVFEEGDRLRLIDMPTLEATMHRHHGRRGLKPLVLAIERFRPLPDIRSELERDFVTLYRGAGVPEPHCNVLVKGLLVDFYWPEAKLVVELDSRGFHGHWEAAERDRVRDARLMRHQIHTLRLTKRRLVHEPREIIADIRARFLHETERVSF